MRSAPEPTEDRPERIRRADARAEPRPADSPPRRPAGSRPARPGSARPGSARPGSARPGSAIGRLPRVLLAVILVIMLAGVARATDVVALVKASTHRSTAPATAPGAASAGNGAASAPVAPLGPLHSADVLLTADHTIPANAIADITRMPGVESTESFRYGTVDLAGNRVPAYGVDPSTFRSWAVQATASSTAFWSSLAGGEASASFQTGKDLNLPLGARLPIGARSTEVLRLGSFATVGLPDAEAVLSDTSAAAIGLPAGSGLLISAPSADLRVFTETLRAVSGAGIAVRPLKPLPAAPRSTPVPRDEPSASSALPSGVPSDTGSTGAGFSGGGTSSGSAPAPTSASASAVIAAAKSKIGAPYVYGASGPDSFDCSGFTSWVYRQVGIGLPRTAQEQWLAGPHVSYSDAQPGDILAWAGDPSAPGYVTHVAIYLGNGQMISAPHTGTTVGISSVYTSGLLGAVRVLA